VQLISRHDLVNVTATLTYRGTVEIADVLEQHFKTTDGAR